MPALDVTDATFERDVLDRSVEVPVVVDLWAEWCGPCRTLGPIIEAVVGATEGKVELAKVDIDANPRVAATFQVQSIPAVYALRDRQVVDSFIGALPEPAVTEFVRRLAPAPSEADTLVVAGDEASLRRAIEIEPDHPGAIVALAEVLVEQGHGDEAIDLLSRIPESAQTRTVAARARVSTAPADGEGDQSTDVEAELADLLELVREDDAARQRFVDLLEVLGADDPRTPRWRKALTSRLF